MRSLLFTAMFGGCLGIIVPEAGQSLADVARNTEAARNATAERPRAKVYTNKDLVAVDPAAAAPPSNSTAPAPKPAPPQSGETPRSDVKGEAYWRDRMKPLRERLDRARAAADDTKRQADALMRSADRCFQIGVVCADYTESLRLAEAHKALVQDVASAEREVAALEEEARRAGVPPGWLRE